MTAFGTADVSAIDQRALALASCPSSVAKYLLYCRVTSWWIAPPMAYRGRCRDAQENLLNALATHQDAITSLLAFKTVDARR